MQIHLHMYLSSKGLEGTTSKAKLKYRTLFTAAPAPFTRMPFLLLLHHELFGLTYWTPPIIIRLIEWGFFLIGIDDFSLSPISKGKRP